MLIRSVYIGTIVLVALAQSASAGIYSTIDNRQHETPFSLDYGTVFKKVLGDLTTIPLPDPPSNPPIRRRYVLMEALAPGGTPQLGTLEQKLNYSAMLIRRNRALEAARFLDNVYKEDDKNFVVLSQYASALFLSKERDREVHAPDFMREALHNWPKNWADVTDDQKKMLTVLGWDEFDFDRFRRCEECFARLIAGRLKENKLRLKNMPFEETVDPIFLDAKNQPVRFVNDKGDFEVGRISDSAKEQLPIDAVEVVEQLLLWMPADDRLLWLLAETFNASAMGDKDAKRHQQKLTSSFEIFSKLTNLERPAQHGRKEIHAHYEALKQHFDSIKEPNIDPKDTETPTSPWWRIGVGFVTGLAIGMFALWQIQEMRRRRQSRNTNLH